jgi:hypothetical protein
VEQLEELRGCVYQKVATGSVAIICTGSVVYIAYRVFLQYCHLRFRREYCTLGDVLEVEQLAVVDAGEGGLDAAETEGRCHARDVGGGLSL